MNHETAKFVKELFIKHAGFVPDNKHKHFDDVDSTDEYVILSELCEALNIYVDSDEGE